VRDGIAEGTTVSVEKSRAEIEKLITRYGATSTAFMSAPGRSVVCFEADGRRIMFELKLPERTEKRFLRDGRGSLMSPIKQAEKWEQACRQRWRALVLVIKAKLEAVESGITTDEFLAHIVMPDGQTVATHIKPRIAAAYEQGSMVALLPPPSKMQ
jgi:hypothetical protein